MFAPRNSRLMFVAAALAAPVLTTAVAVVPAQSALAAPSGPSLVFTQLTLTNGWTPTSFGTATPAVTVANGIAYFKGAISTTPTNASDAPFTVPSGFRPSKVVYLPTNMCDSSSGELYVPPTGAAQAISNGASANENCFTSLDGVSFALSAASFTPLKLGQGWQNPANSGRRAGVRLVDGIVRFEGEIRKTGKNPILFTLPAKFRPATDVALHVNMCTGSLGQLSITPKGVVREQPEENLTFAPKCGISLDGASFALPSKTFTPLKLINGWKNAHGMAAAAVRVRSGIVQFRGAISTKAAIASAFVLPAQFRPASNVFVTVTLCGGNNGRLDIAADGDVSIEAEGGDFAAAQCLTSMEGTWFAR